MERLDFASITQILRLETEEGRFSNQMDFADTLLFDYLESKEAYLDAGQLNRWLNGLTKLSPAITVYYLDNRKHQTELSKALENSILPYLSDSEMTLRKVYDLLMRDPSISERKKAELAAGYPCETKNNAAVWLTKLLVFGMARPFQARDIRKPNRISSGASSPSLRGYILNEPPHPCPWFCGREQELDALHTEFVNHSKVFLSGIPGIGKSEFAKAFAQKYRKEYTNVLFLPYSGDLRRDIAALDFADDLPGEPIEARFSRHERFLRTMREDTLLIVDNFNVTQTEDAYLPALLQYPCCVLVTTRSNFEDVCCFSIGELGPEALLELTSHFYSGVEHRRATIEQIIETLHQHTFAVELAARLMENGLLSPKKILRKLQKEGASFNATDEIHSSKDGLPKNDTWYRHIHTLFALSRLSKRRRELMRSLTLAPEYGIPARLFGRWMALKNLNDVSLLTELGYVQRMPGRILLLHPMIREVTVSEYPSGIRECGTLLKSVQKECLFHGADLPYETILLQVVENFIRQTVKNDDDVYLRFLEDTFALAEKHDSREMMTLIISELTNLLRDPSVGKTEDRAILLDCRSALETETSAQIALLKEAVALLPDVNAGNALLASNLHANLGGCYRMAGNNSMAEMHMGTALNILMKYKQFGGHDSLTQCFNYAVLLFDMGKHDKAIEMLETLLDVLQNVPADVTSQLAESMESLGLMYLARGEKKAAEECLNFSMRLYTELWSNNPGRLQKKAEELRTTVSQYNSFTIFDQ